jgi:hypothetical protein
MKRIAVIVPLCCVGLLAATIVWACIPDPPPTPTRIIVPVAPVKSLAHWWMLDANMAHGQYYFTHKNPPPPPTLEYYVGSVAPQNLIGRFNDLAVPGGTTWGPAAREEGYEVRHRADYGGEGGQWLTIRVEPRGWSVDRIKADLERCEGKSITLVAN